MENLWGNAYCNGGLLTIDATVELTNISASTHELWHSRLGHVNAASIKRLKHLNLIPSFSNSGLPKL